MRRIAAITLFLVACVADANTFRVEPTNGTVGFEIMKWGVFKEEGTFRDFSAVIVYDRKQPAKSRVEFSIEADSVDTKNDNRDGTLRSEDFFDAKRFPKLSFVSTQVVPRGADRADVTGDLTIKGVTKRVTVPVRLIGFAHRAGVGDLASFETTFRIRRKDFNVTGGRWVAGAPGVLGEDVTVRITAGGVSR
jgi:polyisoprenoid-binding protein YceI